jgi:hypothetical protein
MATTRRRSQELPMSPATTEPTHSSAPPPEAPPVALGYASPLLRIRPAPRLAAALIALAIGLVLLVIVLYALRGLMSSIMSPQALSLRNTDEFIAIMIITCVFAGVCTLMALLFLFIGLKWLRGVSRSAA